MSTEHADHGHGIPDEFIVIGIAGAATALVGLLTAVVLLTNMWAAQAAPDMRVVEHAPPPAAHH